MILCVQMLDVATFEEAVEICAEEGAFLPSIPGKYEEDVIFGTFKPLFL